MLLDYFDFVIHVFRAERRAFYDIERLRKSARPLTPAEFEAELKAELAAKTLAARSKAKIKSASKSAAESKPKTAVKEDGCQEGAKKKGRRKSLTICKHCWFIRGSASHGTRRDSDQDRRAVPLSGTALRSCRLACS
jgi:hypothetical protein